jgi:hypothetical protein
MAAMTIKTGARLMGLAMAGLTLAAQAAEEKPLWEVGRRRRRFQLSGLSRFR